MKISAGLVYYFMDKPFFLPKSKIRMMFCYMEEINGNGTELDMWRTLEAGLFPPVNAQRSQIFFIYLSLNPIPSGKIEIVHAIHWTVRY
jgi:hypothetical protein